MKNAKHEFSIHLFGMTSRQELKIFMLVHLKRNKSEIQSHNMHSCQHVCVEITNHSDGNY